LAGVRETAVGEAAKGDEQAPASRASAVASPASRRRVSDNKACVILP
jgi:hypothetical protein